MERPQLKALDVLCCQHWCKTYWIVQSKQQKPN